MRNADGIFKRSPRCRRARGAGFSNPGAVVPGEAESIPEVARRFTPTATRFAPTGRVFVDLDPYGEREEYRREIFDSRD